MSVETPQPASTPPSPNPPSPGLQGGFASCLGRLTSALLVIVITTFLAVVAVAAGALYLGFTPRSATDLAHAQQRIGDLEARSTELVAQNMVMQTQIVQVISQAGTDRETLDGLADEMQGVSQLRDTLATQITADSRERATLVASMSDSRDAVQAFATAEAGRVQLLDDLRRRSERVERFLQRLSDIAGDTALDIASPTPTPNSLTTATPTAVPSDETTQTATPEAAETPTAETAPTATP